MKPGPKQIIVLLAACFLFGCSMLHSKQRSKPVNIYRVISARMVHKIDSLYYETFHEKNWEYSTIELRDSFGLKALSWQEANSIKITTNIINGKGAGVTVEIDTNFNITQASIQLSTIY